jgi:hypothetical protein
VQRRDKERSQNAAIYRQTPQKTQKKRFYSWSKLVAEMKTSHNG